MDEQFVVPGGDVVVSEAQTDTSPVVLTYIGGEHGAFVFGVPKRDLTQADVEACGLSVDELLQFTPAVYALVNE